MTLIINVFLIDSGYWEFFVLENDLLLKHMIMHTSTSKWSRNGSQCTITATVVVDLLILKENAKYEK